MDQQRNRMSQFLAPGLVAAICLVCAGCPLRDQKQTATYPDPNARFANYTNTCDGIPGELPEHYGYYLTPEQQGA